MQSIRVLRWTAFFCAMYTASFAQGFRKSSEFLSMDKGMDLGSLLALAEKNNPAIQAATADTAASRGLRVQAGYRPNPTMETSYLSGPVVRNGGEDQFGAEYAHTFERGGKRARRIDAAERETDSATARERLLGRQTGIAVKRAYVEALAAVRLLASTEAILELNRENLRLTEARAQQGEASALEVRLLEVERSRFEADLPTLSGAAEMAIEELAALTMISSQGLLLQDRPVMASDTSAAVDGLIATASGSRPELAVAQAAIEKARAELRLAKANATPDVTGFVQFGKARSQNAQFGVNADGLPERVRDNDNVLGGGVRMTLPVYNRNRGNIAAAEAAVRAAELRAANVSRLVERDIRAAYVRWRAAIAAAQRIDQQVLRQSRDNLRTIRSAYQLGELRLLDVLQEQRRVAEFERVSAETRRAEALALVDLEEATGMNLISQAGAPRP